MFPGSYVPSSSAARSTGSSAGQCLRTCSMLCRSGPGAPSFDATLSNAYVNRLHTSSIVADVALSFLCFGFGAACVAAIGRPVAATPTAPCGFSAVPKRSCCCNARSLTVAALAPPALSTRRVTAPFRWPCTFVRRSRLCWVIGPSVLAFSGLPLARTPSRRSWVRPTDFVLILVPVHLHLRRVSGFTAERRLTRCSCLTALRFRLNEHAPTTSTRPALSGPVAACCPPRGHRCSGAKPLSPWCWVPHVRAPGLDFHLLSVGHASRTLRSPRSARLAAERTMLRLPSGVVLEGQNALRLFRAAARLAS